MDFFEKKLVKFHLKEVVYVQLPIDATAFVQEFRKRVSHGNATNHFSMAELLSKNNKEFVGTIKDGSFSIRRRKQFFDFSNVYAKAEGNYAIVDGTLQIKIEIKALYFLILLYWAAGAAALLVFLFKEYQTATMTSEFLSSWYILPFFLIVVYILPYIFLRNSITHLKITLQRELLTLI